MRILVTGGAGYIGSVITEQLIKEGQEVFVIDNLSKGHEQAVIGSATFFESDLRDTGRLKELLNQYRIEAVIHMAASSLVGESVKAPREYYDNNVQVSLGLLNTMVDCNIPRIVFSSTAAVYGEPSKQPIEESDPTNPTNPYGATKLAFEHALESYRRAYGIQSASLRYFNAAGASELFGEDHDPESHLIPNVLQVASGKREYVEIFGDDYATPDGTCVRDYIHVIDLARAHILALTSMEKRSSIFNLGCGGNGYSVKEVIDVARRITGHPIPARITARRPGDPPTLIASSDRIRNELGWKPSLQNLEAIVDSAWKWLQKHPGGYSS